MSFTKWNETWEQNGTEQKKDCLIDAVNQGPKTCIGNAVEH